MKTQEEFKKKWQGDIEGYWAEDADRLFWARCYCMDMIALVEMSKDFVLLCHEEGLSGMRKNWSSSWCKAHNTLKEFDDKYKEYGIAGLL